MPDQISMKRGISRRSFVQSAALAGAGLLAASAPALAAALQRRPILDQFSDLRRHFVFEYYPWYRTDPWEHWPEGGHHPPADFGSNYLPALGLYDSRSLAVMERHARWIAESGAGAIDVSWSRASDRSAAEAVSKDRIAQSFHTTVELQTRPGLTNAKQGFFLAYINSFNEWHEGHQFEPARNRVDLTHDERARGYHNAEQGDYRLQTLRTLITRTLDEIP